MLYIPFKITLQDDNILQHKNALTRYLAIRLDCNVSSKA